MIRKYNLSESPSYCRYWGKATVGGNSQAGYHLLPYHCLDVAAVGDILLTRHLLSQTEKFSEIQNTALLILHLYAVRINVESGITHTIQLSIIKIANFNDVLNRDQFQPSLIIVRI